MTGTMEKEPKRFNGIPLFNLVVGSVFGAAAGRSNLVIRFVYGRFAGEYDPTIEDSYRTKAVIDGEEFFVDCLDTAGGEDYPALRNQYFMKADGILFVYDVTRRETFDQLKPFVDEIKTLLKKDQLPAVICGNKIDLSEQRQVQSSEGKAFADSLGIPFIETSAKTGENVEEAFFTVIRTCRPNENDNLHEKKDEGRRQCIIC